MNSIGGCPPEDAGPSSCVFSDGSSISAHRLAAELGIGSDQTAWMMLAKQRRGVVDPNRDAVKDLVEVDEASQPQSIREDPVAGRLGRSHEGKMLIIGAVEMANDPAGCPLLAPIKDYSTKCLRAILTDKTRVETDRWCGYTSLPNHTRRPRFSVQWLRTSC